MSRFSLSELPKAIPTADVLVIGSGLAGAAIAKSLSEKGHAVMILESGNSSNPDAKWNITRDQFKTADYGVALDYSALHVRRQFGGGSAVWAGWCARPRDVTFERGRLFAEYGWPYKREELDGYYDSAAEFLKLNAIGSRAYEDVALVSEKSAVAIPFHFSPPVRVYDDYSETFRRSEKITVIEDATVSQLLEEGGAISGCVAKSPDGTGIRFTARYVVLAGGAVGNPRLLLTLPADTSIPGFGRNHVGRWLHEHPHRYKLFHCILKPDIDKEIGDRALINASGFISLAPSTAKVREKKWNDFNFQLWPVKGEEAPEIIPIAANFKATFGFDPTIYRASLGMEEKPNYDFSTIQPQELSAGLDGHLRLRFGDEQEKVAAAATGWFTETIAHSVIRASQQPDIVAVGHLHGTTRMSDTPQEGVVDRTTKVFGLANLYIAGSSIFPSAGFANPTFTICAMAFLTADEIHEKLSK
jgi:choline dehydrogenase-like flavoprotein